MHDGVKAVAADLQRIFGARLESLVRYGDVDDPDGVHTLALLDRVAFGDLAACAPHVPDWRRAGAAVPLLLSRDEFLRSLDVFPIEYGGIIEAHVLIAGRDPFAGIEVNQADLRRACELQTKSHLIHLREAYLESGNEPRRLAAIMASSALPLRALAGNLDRLEPGAAARAGITPEFIREVASADGSTIAEPSALLARYIAAVERLWHEVDRWRA